MSDTHWKAQRVVITRPMVGICHMQVCAVENATDEEILAVCNAMNASGTTNGWTHVIRESEPKSDFWPTESMKPTPCQQDSERVHFLVSC